MVSSHDAYQTGNGPPDSAGDSQTKSPQPPPLPPRRVKRSGLWRVLLWLGVGLVGVLALLLIGVWWIGEHLGDPRIKSRLQALAKDNAGLAIDYDGLDVSLSSGVRARSLTVSQPARFSSAAPDFVRIDDLELRASAWALADGSRVLDLVRVGRVDVTIVRDESGATTISELFPSKPQAPKQPPTKLSQSLASLPDLGVTQISVGALLGRLIDLHQASPPRVASLASVGLHGALHGAPHSLRGTDLQISGAPVLRLEIRDANEALQFAEASLLVGVRADAAESIAIRVHSDLGKQNLLPDWAHVSELLNLDLSVLFDEHAGRTSLSASDFRASGGMLSAAVGVEVFDADALRVLANGKANLNIQRLPMQVPGLSLDALALTLQAKQLAWQADRIAGALDWSGSIRGLSFERAGQSAQLTDTKLLGQGAFQGPSGDFSAMLGSAAIVARSSAGTAKLTDMTLNLIGKTHEAAGNKQSADADLVLALPAVSFVSESGDKVDVASLNLDTRVSGLIAELSAKLIPKLDSKLAIEHVAAVSGRQRVVVDNLSLALAGTNLAQDETSGSGAKGTIDASLALPKLRAVGLAIDGWDMHVQLPLSLAQVTGKLSIASLKAQDSALNALQLDLDLDTPLAWLPDAAGPAQVRVTGHVGGVHSAEHRAVIEALHLVANRFDKDRYRLELSTEASSLMTSGHKVPGRINMDIRADAAPLAGTFVMSAGLRGARDAAVDLKLDASLANDQRLRYEASLSAEKLDAFAALIYGVAPGATPVKVEGARFHASAKGDFTGVLRREQGALPLLAADPLASARGQQSLELALTGLDYHGADRSVVIPELTLKLGSVHGDAGAGSADARFSARTVQYDGAGTSVHLEGLEQKLTAKFDRAPDLGIVDVQSDLQLGSAVQSIFPAYPVVGLRFDTHLQIDRLRSIFLRDFALENPSAGTELHAHGALELRTRTREGEPDHKTLVGREALALEGSLKQTLAPFEKLGFVSHASGSIEMPFHLESGGLLGYRLLATLQAQQVSLATADHSLDIEELNGIIPLLEEFALLPGGIVVSSGPRSSPLSETRFFDVHPFLSGKDYVTARSITLRGLQPLGPLAANVRIERSDFLIDQLQVGLNGGQIVGQVRIAYRDGDPLVRVRLDGTGIRTAKSSDVFDANAALSFVPKAMTLDGKVQLIRVSRSHLLGILDVVDPFHESASANRIRQGLTFGYPKFVRFQFHDGALDTKVELGGLAKLIRIDEIKAVPLGPILERYVAPLLSGYLPSAPAQNPTSVPPATAEKSE